MNLKKNLLALSVGAVIAAASTAANANSLLFPYFNFNNSGNLSFMSLQTSSTVTPGSKNIHWVYFGAPTGTSGSYTPDSFCQHQQDGFGTMTPNDMVNMLVSADPATPTDTTSGNRFGDKSSTFSLTLPAAAGFVVVSNVTASGVAGTTTTAQDLTGEMVVVNANPNVVFGYSAVTNNGTAEGDFSNITAQQYNMSWYPSSAMDTQWYALAANDQSAAISGNGNWTAVANAKIGTVYDRDEVALSQNVTASVGCGTSLTLGAPSDATGQQVVSPANQVAITNGGLMPITFNQPITAAQTAAGKSLATGVVLFKVETPKFLNNANAFFTMMRNTDGTGKLGF